MIKLVATKDTEIIKSSIIFAELTERLPQNVRLTHSDIFSEIIISVPADNGIETFSIITDMFNESIIMYETKSGNDVDPRPSFTPVMTGTPTEEDDFNEAFIQDIIKYLSHRYDF